MDYDEFRSVLESSGADLWTLIETAIRVASSEFEGEFKRRRSGIVEKLYAPIVPRCPNCDPGSGGGGGGGGLEKPRPCASPKGGSPASPDMSAIEDEQRRLVAIKALVNRPNQKEDTLVDLLQSLADMDITFNALKETDIGRHVNRLRKHSSSEVRRLVKQLVRKWKDLVDDWVRLNTPEVSTPGGIVADGDSPQPTLQKNTSNGHHHQLPDSVCSPNPPPGNSGWDKNHWDHEPGAGQVPPRRTQQSASVSSSFTSNKQREERDSQFTDPDRFDSARKRLQENYQEAKMAKKQRTIQVMDVHDIPKPKNTFFVKNRGSSVQAKHW